MTIISRLLSDAVSKLSNSSESLRVDNIIIGKTFYTMKSSDTTFSDMNFCLVLLENGYGFSYFQEDIDYSLSQYVNQNLTEIISNENLPGYFRVALTDSLYSILHGNTTNDKSLYFCGNLREKAQKRALEIMDKIPEKSNVLLLGAATEIMEIAIDKKINLTVLDLEQQKIGLKFKSITISNRKVDLEYLKKEKFDYIIATGMIFSTDTADSLFLAANQVEAKLILYMESGSNFGRNLVNFGAWKVVCEFFPYYDFYGKTRYAIFSKNND